MLLKIKSKAQLSVYPFAIANRSSSRVIGISSASDFRPIKNESEGGVNRPFAVMKRDMPLARDRICVILREGSWLRRLSADLRPVVLGSS